MVSNASLQRPQRHFLTTDGGSCMNKCSHCGGCACPRFAFFPHKGISSPSPPPGETFLCSLRGQEGEVILERVDMTHQVQSDQEGQLNPASNLQLG